MDEAPGPVEETPGGDPVCWLDRVCPDCGAMPSADGGARCWRCGRRPDPDEHPGPA